MDIYLILTIVSYILFALSIIMIPYKRNNTLKEAGNMILGFPVPPSKKTLLVQIVGFVLITIVFFIRYEILITIILCACGILGAWIVMPEAALGSKYGLYENGIIAVGKFIPYEDIMAFPILSLPKSEQMNHPQNVLTLVSRKYGKLELYFENDEICMEVIRQLRQMRVIK